MPEDGSGNRREWRTVSTAASLGKMKTENYLSGFAKSRQSDLNRGVSVEW